MPWTPPCGDPPPPGCPYASWLRDPKAERDAMRRFGRDRYGRQRYQCTAGDCHRTFYAPPYRSDRIGFKAYMRNEVHLARAQATPERFGAIASRLGVSRATAVRWHDEWISAAQGEAPPVVPPMAHLGMGRQARLVQDRDAAPYTIAPIDQEWFVQASVGEIRHFLRRREFRNRAAAEAKLAEIAARSEPMESRDRKLMEFGAAVREAFHDVLGLTPKPAVRPTTP